MREFIILLGFSGSGKTTYAKHLERQGYTYIDYDDIKRRDDIFIQIAEFARNNEKCVLDGVLFGAYMEDFITSVGAEAVDFPYKNECCGSYLSISEPKIAAKVSYKILNSAQKNGANVLITTCPLCYYNLDRKQGEIKEVYPDFKNIPILFFTQLLAQALELDIDILGLDQHYIDPRPLLEENNLI